MEARCWRRWDSIAASSDHSKSSPGGVKEELCVVDALGVGRLVSSSSHGGGLSLRNKLHFEREPRCVEDVDSEESLRSRRSQKHVERAEAVPTVQVTAKIPLKGKLILRDRSTACIVSFKALQSRLQSVRKHRRNVCLDLRCVKRHHGDLTGRPLAPVITQPIRAPT